MVSGCTQIGSLESMNVSPAQASNRVRPITPAIACEARGGTALPIRSLRFRPLRTLDAGAAKDCSQPLRLKRGVKPATTTKVFEVDCYPLKSPHIGWCPSSVRLAGPEQILHNYQ